MVPDSSAIDAALLTKLVADPILTGYMPDGVYWDEAKAGATRFVIVSLIDASDVQQFGGRAFEEPLYLVKAVALASTGANILGAAARIDALLDPQPPLPPATLTVEGYGVLNIQREARLRITEVDEQNTDIRWLHRGGHYRVTVAPSTT